MKHLFQLVIVAVISLCSITTNIYAQNTAKQLNITFLLDLSDRIDPNLHNEVPSPTDRDIAIVKNVIARFKQDMRERGAYRAKGKIKVLFRPAPNNTSINRIAQNLDVSLADIQVAQKRQIYDNIEARFTSNLKKIYQQTLQSKNYIGSDIWSFFKNDADILAIDTDPNYRNILIILTDGYLYHKNSKRKSAHKYSYLLPTQIRSLGLTTGNWQNKMQKLKFGLLVPRKGLGNLEVLMLELNPSKQSPYEYDVMKTVLTKWLKDMGVKKFGIYQTDLSSTTKRYIDRFL